MDLEYFSDFSNTLHKIKEVRNMIAHSLKTINRDDFNSEAKVGIDTINKEIIYFSVSKISFAILFISS